jgi:hypothetical protein
VSAVLYAVIEEEGATPTRKRILAGDRRLLNDVLPGLERAARDEARKQARGG